MSDQTYHVMMAVLFVLVSGGYFLEAMRQFDLDAYGASDFRYAQVLAEKLIGWAIITAFFAWLWL
ncbi:hypothetical protein AB7008_41565 [Bradyrhizobium sp. 521_C7_N1_3]|uniref:hypothetical protein n=1 Tax=Bradyrhizobium TaxID=374 RepID=UPI0022268F5C|nr:hypothetical protein [Bradyrhizobium japonicum]MCW2218778.1 hypothetical protein [Bradyrhizobium japonicum]MCW2343392.1 hypothetical protein [Bradyrhizobium japonicum]